MNSSKYTFRVERSNEPGTDCGQHKTLAAAQKRVARLVSMSNGKRTAADFRIVDDSKPE
jgi:hypothetical protein